MFCWSHVLPFLISFYCSELSFSVQPPGPWLQFESARHARQTLVGNMSFSACQAANCLTEPSARRFALLLAMIMVRASSFKTEKICVFCFRLFLLALFLPVFSIQKYVFDSCLVSNHLLNLIHRALSVVVQRMSLCSKCISVTNGRSSVANESESISTGGGRFHWGKILPFNPDLNLEGERGGKRDLMSEW